MRSFISTLHFVYLGICIIIFCSCQNKSQHRKIVDDLLGKEINIPKNLKYLIINDSINYDFNDADFKILCIINSKGCTRCKMKLKEWNRLINDLKYRHHVFDINFLMVVNTMDEASISKLLKSEIFLHPITIDKSNAFRISNSFPDNDVYTTYLLDRENRIIAIGNPAINPKIRELYEEIITTEEKKIGIASNLGSLMPPSISCNHPLRSVGIINKNDTIQKIFRIENRGRRTLTIQNISPSCDCISVMQPLDSCFLSKSSNEIEVRYVADSVSGPFMRYINIFFNETKYPLKLFLHGFVK